MVSISEKLNANVLCFNYRGVGKSSGISLHGNTLTSDAVKVIKYANETLRVDYQNIIIYGFSLGGAIAGTALTKAHFGDDLNKLRFINDRSFSKAKAAAMSLIRVPLYSHFLRWITKSNWNLKPSENAEELKGRILIITSPQDAVIPQQASYFNKSKDHASRVLILDFSKHVDAIKSLWGRFKAHGEAHYYDLNEATLENIAKWIESTQQS